MEPPKKIAGTNDKTTIFNLNKELIDHIASYLTLKDLARMSCSSKPWTNLCYTTPCLTINTEFEKSNRNPSATGPETANRDAFLSFVDRILIRRLQKSMERFSLTSTCPPSFEYRVETWIKAAIYFNVQELDLLIDPKSLILPRQIFTLSSLKVLHLNMNLRQLQLPSSVQMINLQTLSLKLVELPNDPIGTWVSAQTPSLRTLNLIDCHGFSTLNINLSSIEALKILDPTYGQLCNIKIDCHNLKTLELCLTSPFHDKSSLTLETPNVQSLRWWGRIVSQFHATTLASLQGAAIAYTSAQMNHSVPEIGTQFVRSLFPYLKHLNNLRLCSWFTQVIALAIRTDHQYSLPSLGHLQLYSRLSNSETCLIMLFLSRSPNLKTLVIKEQINSMPAFSADIYKDIEGYQNMKFGNHLKMAEIRLLGSGENTLTLVKCLLNNAKQLEKLTIPHSHSDSDLAKTIDQELIDFERPPSLPGIDLLRDRADSD